MRIVEEAVVPILEASYPKIEKKFPDVRGGEGSEFYLLFLDCCLFGKGLAASMLHDNNGRCVVECWMCVRAFPRVKSKDACAFRV